MLNFVLNFTSPMFYKILYMSIIGIFVGLFILILRKILDNDANHTSVAVIDDLLHGVLQFCLTFISDHGDLVSHAIHHQLFDRFSENIGSPDSIRALCRLVDIIYQILCLLLTPHDRCDLGLNVSSDHMDRRCFRTDLYSVFIALPDYHWIVQPDFFSCRADYTVAFHFN